MYNVEKEIVQCIESVVQSKRDDFELILVDDCSTDGSLYICKEYEKRYNQVHLYQQENNQGVSRARNLGITYAKGKYILFLDSDDFVAVNYFDVIEKYTEKQYDLISFGHYDYIVKEDTEKVKKSNMNCDDTRIENKEEKLRQLFLDSFFASPCNKVYKREIILQYNIKFDEKCVCFEDYLFNLEYCRHIMSFILTDTPIYYYRQIYGCDSTSKRKWKKIFDVSREVARKTNVFIEELSVLGDVRYLRRYTYKAFMTELEYVYRNKKDERKQYMEELVKDKEFDRAVASIVPAGKKLFVYKIFSKFNLKLLKLIVLKKIICEEIQVE